MSAIQKFKEFAKLSSRYTAFLIYYILCGYAPFASPNHSLLPGQLALIPFLVCLSGTVMLSSWSVILWPLHSPPRLI